jgi:hypothetical protein
VRVLERAELQRRRRIGERECAQPSAHPLLALQRGAGNQAVARAVAQRRTLARSCEADDEAAQIALHDAHFMAVAAEGAAMINAAHAPRQAPQPAQPTAAPAHQILPRGGPPAQAMTFHLAADDDGVIYESDEDEETASTEMDRDDEPWFVWPPTGEIVPLSVLLNANVPLDIIRGLPRPGEESDDETGMDEDDRMIGRQLARNYDPNKARTRQVPTTKAHTFTGFPGDNPAVIAAGVAEKTKVKRRGLRYGSGTNSTTRPPGWWDFIPLTGMGPSGVAHTRYIMGHLLNAKFGGQGNDMRNLSVFTMRLNSHHKVQVEIPLQTFLGGGAKGHTRSIDYTVTPIYGTPSAVIADTTMMFDAFLTANRTKALSTWVRLGLIDALDVPNLLTATLTDPVVLTKGGTWAALVASARALALQYVTDHFPASIVCNARQYDLAPGAAAWDKTVRMDETIQHLA